MSMNIKHIPLLGNKKQWLCKWKYKITMELLEGPDLILQVHVQNQEGQ